MLAQLPVAYHEMTENRLGSYLALLPEIADRLGGQPAQWQISDVNAGVTALGRVVGHGRRRGAVCQNVSSENNENAQGEP